ncbi:hypothetical protein DsansV1_C01g0001861 [Dioscorea sansibarensis]
MLNYSLNFIGSHFGSLILHACTPSQSHQPHLTSPRISCSITHSCTFDHKVLIEECVRYITLTNVLGNKAS